MRGGRGNFLYQVPPVLPSRSVTPSLPFPPQGGGEKIFHPQLLLPPQGGGERIKRKWCVRRTLGGGDALPIRETGETLCKGQPWESEYAGAGGGGGGGRRAGAGQGEGARREFYLINKIATITAHSQDLQDIMNKVLVAVLEFFGVEAGLLLLWNRKKQRLSYAASRGFPGKYLVDIARSGLEAVVGDNLARVNQPLIIRDVRKDPRLHTSTFTELIRQDPSFRALVSIPLKYRDEVTGFLNLAAESAAPFRASRRKKYFLSILGNQIGLAIENARLYHELHRSEHRYRRIFEGSKDMIFITDREGKLLDLNPAGVELLKFASKQEALDLPHVREIFQEPRDWERFQLKVEVEGFIRDMELTLATQGQGQVQTLLTGIVRRDQDGRITGYEGIFKDITARKRAEWELLREKKTTEGILEGMPVPTFVIDRDHRIIYWNKACEELTGVSRHEMVGTYRYWMPFYTHERPSMASLVVEQNIKALEKFFGDKNLKPSPNLPGAYEAYEYLPNFRGRERYLYHTASPIYDEEGRIRGAVQAILDMTEREQLSRELTNSEEKFRRLVETSLDGIVLHQRHEAALRQPGLPGDVRLPGARRDAGRLADGVSGPQVPPGGVPLAGADWSGARPGPASSK